MRQFRILSMFWAIFLGTGNFSAYSQQMPERLKDKGPAKPQGKDIGGTMRSNAGLVPPGIMIGEAKRWMVAYQGMFDKMQGNLVGSRRIDEATILQQFKATPTDMTMQFIWQW